MVSDSCKISILRYQLKSDTVPIGGDMEAISFCFLRNTLIGIFQLAPNRYTFATLFELGGACEVYHCQCAFLTPFEANFAAKRQVVKAEAGRSRSPLLAIGFDGRIYAHSEEALDLGYKEGLFLWEATSVTTLQSFPDLALQLVEAVGGEA